jgi:hypothetical protein
MTARETVAEAVSVAVSQPDNLSCSRAKLVNKVKVDSKVKAVNVVEAVCRLVDNRARVVNQPAEIAEIESGIPGPYRHLFKSRSRPEMQPSFEVRAALDLT